MPLLSPPGETPDWGGTGRVFFPTGPALVFSSERWTGWFACKQPCVLSPPAMRLILLALCLLVTLPARAAGPGLRATLDLLYQKRSDPAAAREQGAELSRVFEAAPEDGELTWRKACILSWQADGAREETWKKDLVRQPWDAGEKAVQPDPARVEGNAFAATGMGAYSQAVGIMKALGEGLEGKFNLNFELGAPLLAKGGYSSALPGAWWDLGTSAALYEKVIAKHASDAARAALPRRDAPAGRPSREGA